MSVNLSIRAKEQQRDLIDQAAERLGRTRSDFMLEAACREAERVLLDQAYFSVGEEAFASFQQMLDNPPKPSERLKRLLRQKAPWESE